MELTAHFTDIQEKIASELSKAKYNIFVAVAWITDKSLWDILMKKSRDGVVVQIILINDDINKGTGIDFENFVINGGQLYWDDHHHKFCVIDVKTVITGSYNWTYYAQNRVKRENVIVIKGATDIAEQFSDEFKLLLKQASRFELPKEIVYVEKEVIREVEKKIIKKIPVHKNVVEEKVIKVRETLKPAHWYNTQEKRAFWWDTLNENWKKIFNESVLGNKHDNLVKPNDTKIEKLFKLNRLDLTFYEKTKVNITELSGLENLTNLQEINLTNHKVNKEEIENILSLNPICKIIGQ
jgi:phosphatidylserine/phosphatidylglycerophosphate/cardiolipin synthase-like enzyme